jgi:hypothetical protein
MVKHTRVLYPLSYPVDNSTSYFYVESPPPANHISEASNLIKKYHAFIEIELPLATNEIIRTNLKVNKELDKNNKTVTKYTIQYEDRSNNTIIRADNKHQYPHIDLYLPNSNKEKRIFDTDPSDYEAAINTVLRYAEFHNSHTVGVDYWLFNLVTFKRELVYSFFKNIRGHCRRYFRAITADTDVARLVSVEMLTAKGEVNYDYQMLAKVITNKFFECMIYENQHNRPQKISKNLIQAEVNVNLLPFPLVLSNSMPTKLAFFDSSGHELPPDGRFSMLGKTTYQDI